MPEDVKHVCLKCGEAMEVGWLVDNAYGPMQKHVSHWKPGAPKRRTFLARLKQSFGREEGLPIIAYRCVQCGFLEHYARPMDWPQIT